MSQVLSHMFAPLMFGWFGWAAVFCFFNVITVASPSHARCCLHIRLKIHPLFFILFSPVMQKKRIKVQGFAPREWYVLKNRKTFFFPFLFSCCRVNSAFHSFLSSSRGITLLTVLPLLLLSLLKIIITCQPVETRSHWRQV